MTAPIVGAPDTAAGVAGQAQGQNTDDNSIVGQPDAERKRFATAAALAAQAGCTLHELSSGGYLLGRWTFCKELPDLNAVHQLLRRIMGSHP